MMTQKKLISAAEAMEILKCDHNTLRQLTDRGILDAVKLECGWLRWKKDEVQGYADDPLLSKEEAADFIGWSVGTLGVWTNRGYVESEKFGGQRWYKLSDLEPFMDQPEPKEGE